MDASPRKPFATSLVALALAVSGFALAAAAPATARTICDEYGRCYNTSGAPIYNGPVYNGPGWGWHRHYPVYYHPHHWHDDPNRY
jgi:hypothetical protein